MKKVISLILSAVLALSFAACKQKSVSSSNSKSSETAATAAESSVKSAENTNSPVVTEEVKALVKKAAGSVNGAGYYPVAYLGTQGESGTDRLVLCKITPSVPNPKTTYSLITISENPQGDAEITGEYNSTEEAVSTESVTLSDGKTVDRTESTTLEMTGNASSAFEQALSEVSGVDYNPVALLSTEVTRQNNVVKLTKYSILCKNASASGNQTDYVIVEILENPNGNSKPQIENTFEFKK